MNRKKDQLEEIGAVIGLGNPGREYEKTRHNAGFMVLDRLAYDLSVTFQERKFRAHWGTGAVGDRRIVLCKPLTYMNRSGEAVSEILKYFDIPLPMALVVHDDLDLPCGRIRLMRRGGSGGHRGVNSMMELLKSQDFPRIKLGIGRPLHGEPVEDYVLQAPYSEEAEAFDGMISQGVEAAKVAIFSGLDAAMNEFNR